MGTLRFEEVPGSNGSVNTKRKGVRTAAPVWALRPSSLVTSGNAEPTVEVAIPLLEVRFLTFGRRAKGHFEMLMKLQPLSPKQMPVGFARIGGH